MHSVPRRTTFIMCDVTVIACSTARAATGGTSPLPRQECKVPEGQQAARINAQIISSDLGLLFVIQLPLLMASLALFKFRGTIKLNDFRS